MFEGREDLSSYAGRVGPTRGEHWLVMLSMADKVTAPQHVPMKLKAVSGSN